VAAAGISYTSYEGAALTESLWDTFYELYLTTIQIRGDPIPHSAVLFLNRGNVPPASYFLWRSKVKERWPRPCISGDDTLYGRYWGANIGVPGLHFETCYYQAIEYCLAHGLSRFEAGAQGEHKLSRGFLPTPTYSLHWLRHPEFNRAVEEFLIRENRGLELTINELTDHSPFHKPS